MKRLLVILLSFHMAFQASSIIHKAIPYIDNPGSQSATIHAVSGIKNIDLSKLALDYWNHLKTKEGDYYLYSLITDETLQNGNKRFGLTAEDVEQIKKFILKYKIFEAPQYFAFPVLPDWLQKIYENKQDELIQKLEAEFNYGNWKFYKKEGFCLGVLENMVQKVWQNTKGCKQYLYVQTNHRYSYATDVSYLTTAINLIYRKYAYIADLEDPKDIEDDKSRGLDYQYIILPQKDLNNESYFKILAKCLEKKEDVTLLIAFQDSDLATPVLFGITRGSLFLGFLETIKVENIVITGKNLQRIRTNFFNKNIHLKSLELPDGITQVGGYFLEECKGLEKVVLPLSLNKVGVNFLNECISLKNLELPNGLTEVGDGFLQKCSKLEAVNLPSSFNKVGTHFFYECSSLKSLELPDGVTEVGDSFLAECSALQEIKLPSGLNKVGNHFLWGCSSLKKLELPDGVTEVGYNFLYKCSRLEKVRLPSGLNKVGNHFLWRCSSLKKIELPDGVTEVGDSFFAGCSALEEIKLPSGLNKVGDHFLAGCINLKNLELPNGLREVAKFFLYKCSALRSLQLPDTLTQVGDSFLKNCSDLRVIFMDKTLHTYLIGKNYIVPEIAEKIRFNSELMTYQEFNNKLLNPSGWDYLLGNQEKWHIENHIYLQDQYLKLNELESLFKSFLKIKSISEDVKNKKQLMIILTNVLAKLENK